MSTVAESGAAIVQDAPLATAGGVDRLSIVMTVLTAAFLAAAIAPLLVVEVPAMLDYPNHLARMYLLTRPANPAYEAHWGLYPDLAMDLVVPALATGMSVAAATKLFLAASQVLVVTGAVFLELTVKRRHRLAGPAALLALLSLPFAWGQLNFLFGLGLAVWSVALWIRLRDRPGWIRWTVHAAAVGLLSVAHLFDLGVYGLVIGLYELSRFQRPPTLASLSRLGLFMTSPVLAVAAVLALGARGEPGPVIGLDWDLDFKLGWPAVFLNVYDTGLSILSAGVLSVLVLALALTRRLSLTRAGFWIAGGLAALYLALPRELLGSQYLDVRLLTAALLILPAFAAISLRTARWRTAPLATVLALVAAGQAVTTRAWFDYDRDFKEFSGSFKLLPEGSAVLIGQRDEAGRDFQPVYYAATLAAPAAGVFVSSLYAQPGAQPIVPRARYRSLAVKRLPDAYPPRLASLRAAMTPNAPAGTQANITGWPRRYQYLYLVGDPGPDPLPSTLTPLAAGRRFSLYRIGPPPQGRPMLR
jgi:hypothetical protein